MISKDLEGIRREIDKREKVLKREMGKLGTMTTQMNILMSEINDLKSKMAKCGHRCDQLNEELGALKSKESALIDRQSALMKSVGDLKTLLGVDKIDKESLVIGYINGRFGSLVADKKLCIVSLYLNDKLDNNLAMSLYEVEIHFDGFGRVKEYEVRYME